MAFILEKISEEDMKKYGFETKPHLKKMWKSWAIDKERGVFLIKTGGIAMSAGRYELYYPNVGVVNFDAEEFLRQEDPRDKKYYPIFSIISVRVPELLKSKIETVKFDVQESLKIFGYFANQKFEQFVTVNLPEDSKIHFKKGE